MQLHMALRFSCVSDARRTAVCVLQHCTDTYEDATASEARLVDDNGAERSEQPRTLQETWETAELRHALTKADVRGRPGDLITFENGIVCHDELATLCSEVELAAAATEFGVPVNDVRGDVAAVIWEAAEHGGSRVDLNGLSFPDICVVRALSPVRLFPAGMEETPAALLKHFEGRGELRSSQLGAGAAKVVRGMQPGTSHSFC